MRRQESDRHSYAGRGGGWTSGRSPSLHGQATTPASGNANKGDQTPGATSPTQQAVRTITDRPLPFSQPGGMPQSPGSPRTRPHSQPVAPPRTFIGQPKAEAVKAALTRLFSGVPPLVEQEKQTGGHVRFEFSAAFWRQALETDFTQDIVRVCLSWLSRGETARDAISLLDALYRQAKDKAPQQWQATFAQLGMALARSGELTPQEVLPWVRRMKELASAATEQQNLGLAKDALAWAQELVKGFAPDVRGKAATACALVRQWANETSKLDTSPMPATPSAPHGTAVDDQTSTPLGTPTFGHGVPVSTKHRTWVASQHPAPPLNLDLEGSDERPSPRHSARRAYSVLPPFKAPRPAPVDALPPGQALRRALETAQQGAGVQPLIDALREHRLWRKRERERTPYADDAADIEDVDLLERQVLRQVLTIPVPNLEQRFDLLCAAYAIVGPDWNFDAHLRSDYATAIHRWFPGPAKQVLQTQGMLSDRQRFELRGLIQTPALVKTLTSWGLSEDAAALLLNNDAYVGAHDTLFGGSPPWLCVQGSQIDLSFHGGDASCSDAQLMAVLVVCKAWQDACPSLAWALLTATRNKAVTEQRDPRLTERWKAAAIALKQKMSLLESAPAIPLPEVSRKVFASWLIVNLAIDPSSSRVTDLSCTTNGQEAQATTAAARKHVLKKLKTWVESELRNPHGLAWRLILKVLIPVEQQLGQDLQLHPVQWLALTVMECERSGNTKPLVSMLIKLAELQKALLQEAQGQPLLDADLLDRIFLMARREALDPVRCAELIEKTLPLLPARDGPGAVSHTACLQALFAQGDPDIQALLFEAYQEAHPFIDMRDRTPLEWLRTALSEGARPGGAQPLLLLLQWLLPTLTHLQQALRHEGQQEQLLDEALLAKLLLVIQDETLDAVSRANVIQNALPLLPPRKGSAAAAHVDWLLAMLAQDDLDIQGILFETYRKAHPFTAMKDRTPQLFKLASLLGPGGAGWSEIASKAYTKIPWPRAGIHWALWHALCREIARRAAPRICALQQAQDPQVRRALNEWVVHSLNRLTMPKNLSALPAQQAALWVERQAELLADLIEAMPAPQRRHGLEQLDLACVDMIEQSLAAQTGARAADVPASLVALRGVIHALLGRLDDGAHPLQ